mgnify:CR=1 FL=1
MGAKADAIQYITDTFSKISPNTVSIYTNKFKNMTDEEVKKYILNNDIRLYVKDDDVKQKDVDELVKKMGVVLEEKLELNFIKKGLISKEKALIIPVQLRRLQQLATKESASNLESNVRDRTNQATRESKTAQLTDTEVAQMAALGLDSTLTELLSPRSDNAELKQEMNIMLKDNLTFKLADLPKNIKGKSTVNYLDKLYKCINLATDLNDLVEDIS